MRNLSKRLSWGGLAFFLAFSPLAASAKKECDKRPDPPGLSHDWDEHGLQHGWHHGWFHHCNAKTDSIPSSLGADGWATVSGDVTGGCGAIKPKIYYVSNREQLLEALLGEKRPHHQHRWGRWEWHHPDPMPKIIYVQGTIDLNVDDDNVPLTEEDYMSMCDYTAYATFYDPVTKNQTGSGGFFGAYKAAYDPTLWIKQSLDTDGRPPAISGPLEDARACFENKQAERVILTVGSNTSLIGKGTDAKIINGTIRIGHVETMTIPDWRDHGKTITVIDPWHSVKTENVVVRNITFADAFDMFPAWDPKDSFSITITNANGCQATYDPATNSGPHRCTFKGGRWNALFDGINVEWGERVWIDHNTFTDEPRTDGLFPPIFAAPFNEATQKTQHHDGAADIVKGSTQITLSRNLFRNHDKTDLLGGDDPVDPLIGYGPGKIDVTFHHNYYLNAGQRMPRVRFGRAHVYNDFMDVDQRSTAVYKLGDSWVTGTAGKIYAENNLFDVRNSSTVPASKIANYSSTLSNKQLCIDGGWTEAQCGTYFYATGTVVTTIATKTTTTAILDIFTALKAKADGSSSNAPLYKLDPADPNVFWLPAWEYDYTVAPVATKADQDALRLDVKSNAGAGLL